MLLFETLFLPFSPNGSRFSHDVPQKVLTFIRSSEKKRL